MNATAYTCPRCGRTSHHAEDARHRYCGACDRFEAEVEDEAEAEVEDDADDVHSVLVAAVVAAAVALAAIVSAILEGGP